MTLDIASQRELAELACWAADHPEPDGRELAAAEAAAYSVADKREMLHAEAFAALQRVLIGRNPAAGLRLLAACGVLELMVPHVQQMIALSQESGRRHKDVWEHTLAVVQGVPAAPVLRLAALLHDVGKPATYRFSREKGATFHGHPQVGADIARALLAEAHCSPDDRDRVTWLVANHLRPAEHSSAWSDSAVRRFVRDCGDRAADLLSLSRADLTTRNPAKIRRARDNAASLTSRMEAVIAEDALGQPLLKGFGTWLSTGWGLSGREIGIVKRAIEDQVERGELPRREEFSVYESAAASAVAALRTDVSTCDC